MTDPRVYSRVGVKIIWICFNGLSVCLRLIVSQRHSVSWTMIQNMSDKCGIFFYIENIIFNASLLLPLLCICQVYKKFIHRSILTDCNWSNNFMFHCSKSKLLNCPLREVNFLNNLFPLNNVQ